MEMNVEHKVITIKDLGLIEYAHAYAMQMECVRDVLNRTGPFLLLCEHPTVLTMGRMADKGNILTSTDYLEEQGVKVEYIDRGGDVTLHCPGQLVAYFIVDLTEYGKDLRRYLRMLEDVSIGLLNRYGITGRRQKGETGVWVQENKIVSLGIGVKRWVAYHGIGINVNTKLDLFKMIKPCGLNVEMNSISNIIGDKLPMAEVKNNVVAEFVQKFQLRQGD